MMKRMAIMLTSSSNIKKKKNNKMTKNIPLHFFLQLLRLPPFVVLFGG